MAHASSVQVSRHPCRELSDSGLYTCDFQLPGDLTAGPAKCYEKDFPAVDHATRSARVVLAAQRWKNLWRYG
ncbi:MAG: hypothetical protein DME21_05880 [Verrucomicrobia bacterium]|nr:MAG: hypothetical protein DME21_05880 [Verrucomicrobiota bacterium]